MTATAGPGVPRSTQRGGEAVARRREFAWFARFGLVARGVSYGIIGILALQLAVGSGGKTTTQRGALLEIAERPFGQAMLIAMIIGLASYALWRLIRAGIGHGTQDTDSAGERIAGAASGLGYIGLSFTAVQILVGANSGIGRSIALRLAREGASVAVNYYSKPEAAKEVVREIESYGTKAFAVQADVSVEDQADEMFGRIAETFGGLEILVNNAGIESHHEFLEMPLAAWRKVLDVNLTGAFLCAQRAAQLMVQGKAGGAIVNISSVHNVIPWGGYAHYCATKAGLDMLTKTVALELATENVRVNSVAPGAIGTPINEDVWKDPEGLRDLLRKIPTARVGQTEEVAACVAFLCSDEASYVTGAVLYVDGGMTLYPEFRHGG